MLLYQKMLKNKYKLLVFAYGFFELTTGLFMNKSILLFTSILSLSILQAGISSDTLVATPEGQKELGVICVGDKLYCFNEENPEDVAAVATIQEIEVDAAVEITTADGVTIIVAADQRLYSPFKWIQANHLTLEDVLVTKDNLLIRVTNIKHIDTRTTLRYITLDSNPTFWAAANGVLVHNGPVGATVGTIGGAAIVQGAYHGLSLGVCSVITFCTGPLAPPLIHQWYFWTAVPAATATKVGAITGGIVLGTATGPV